MNAVITGGSIANVSMAMMVDSRTYNGTVSGIIRDTAGQAVAGCFVGLYQVTTVGDVTQEHYTYIYSRPIRWKIPLRRRDRRRISGKGKTRTVKPDYGILAVQRFCLKDEQEADIPLCCWSGYRLCGIRVCVEDYCTFDTVELTHCPGCTSDTRRLLSSGRILFGFLSPGEYLLAISRKGRQIFLQIRMPPGGNADICCHLGQCRYQWQYDSFHYFYNSADQTIRPQ